MPKVHAESDFDKYLKEQQNEFRQYIEERDKEFTDFLKSQWKEFQSFQGLKQDEKPKPVKIPVAKPKKLPPVKKPIKIKIIEKPKKLPPVIPVIVKPVPLPPVVENKPDKFKTISVNFYGVDTVFRIDKNYNLKNYYKINNKEISSFWKEISTTDYEPIISEIKNVQKKLLLNDWGMYSLVKEIASKLSKNKNSQTLFTWFVLNKLGFDTKIGYFNNKVYLLVPTRQKVFEVTYFKFSGVKYYAINTAGTKALIKQLYTYKGKYPGADNRLNLNLETLPLIKDVKAYRNLKFKYNNKTYEISASYNREYVKFFAHYPQTDISIYFDADVSADLKQSLYKGLAPLLKGKSEEEAVNIILRFVQTAFKYKTDQQQFGYEKYFLPDETIYYPYCDCEDRSVLFAYLVRNLLGLEVVGLDYPGHIATAVHFKSNVKGDSFIFSGKRYVIADPTYINANVGMTMPQFKNVKPKILKLN
jgi:hypothetical protein